MRETFDGPGHDPPVSPDEARIAIVGTTGSGKTSLAGELSTRLRVPHVELDALFWGPEWTQVPDEVFRDRVSTAVNADRWVADGNYRAVRDLVWSRATTLVWLDPSLLVTFRRLLMRTLRRCLTREELWSGNTESFRTAFFSRNSLLLYAVRTHRRRRRGFADTFRKYPHLKVVRLSSGSSVRCWLSGVGLA